MIKVEALLQFSCSPVAEPDPGCRGHTVTLPLTLGWPTLGEANTRPVVPPSPRWVGPAVGVQIRTGDLVRGPQRALAVHEPCPGGRNTVLGTRGPGGRGRRAGPECRAQAGSLGEKAGRARGWSRENGAGTEPLAGRPPPLGRE